MTSIADFIKLPKKDLLSSIDFGMRYPSFVLWSGFYLPDFPEDGSPVSQMMQAQVREYTSLRIASPENLKKLLLLSITENLADSICQAHYSFNFDFFINCTKDRNFYSLLQKLVQKFTEKSKISLYLPVDASKISAENAGELFSALERDVFEGVFFYGFDKNTAGCLSKELSEVLNRSKNKGLNIKLDAGQYLPSDCLLKLLQCLTPDTLVNSEGACSSEEIIHFLQQNQIQAIITPQTELQYKNFMEEKAKKMRTLLEGGVKTLPATQSILFYNKSISQFAKELCSTGLFSKDEMISILNS